MNKKKSVTHYTEVHFHAPVGQYIDYIENQTVAFDKDMNMQIRDIGSVAQEQTRPDIQDLDIPHEGKYNEVREYIVRRKNTDPDFRYFADTHNLKELCLYLSKQFGWLVNDHALGTNINRHR